MSVEIDRDPEGLAWQIGVWDRISDRDFDDFASAWDVLAGVTTAQLAPERQQEAKAAVMAAMWPDGAGPHHFRNLTQFIVGHRR